MSTLRTFTSTTAGGLILAGTIFMAGPANAQDDLNCDDFASQAAAQANYRADPSDPNRLDANDNGIACENKTDYAEGTIDLTPVSAGAEAKGNPATTDAASEDVDTTSDQESMVMPEGGAATGGGSTSGIEHTSLLAAGGLAFTIGAGGVILAARRVRS